MGRPLTDDQPHSSTAVTLERQHVGPPQLSTKLLLGVVAVLLLVVGLLVVRHFAVQVVTVSGESMEPVLESGDRLVLDKLTYRRRPVRRGDVVVVEPGSELIDVPDKNVKRVVALEGETVTIEEGVVFINGTRLDEPYATGETASPGCAEDNPCTVPEGHIFVLGDNRLESTDSRAFGPVPTDRVAGLVIARIWPPNRVGTL